MKVPKKYQQKRFIVPDPHIVYYDAVHNSPWNQSEEGELPAKGDWTTYRFASKDIIVGVVTHRYNRQTRRLEVRAYFIGEHPVYKEFEPTKAMIIILLSQAYQSGGTLNVFFEQGIPFDIRLLIEKRLGVIISGHENYLSEDLVRKLYTEFSGFSKEMIAHIESKKIPIEHVCFNIYRDIWSTNHIKSMIQRGISLRWIFSTSPHGFSIVNMFMLNHLRAVLLEEYALFRLADRKIGVSAGKKIERIDTQKTTYYTCQHNIIIPDSGTNNQYEPYSLVQLKKNERFCLIPVVPVTLKSLTINLKRDILNAKEIEAIGKPIFILPLDFIYLKKELCDQYQSEITNAGFNIIIVGLTLSQLLTEIEIKLSATAAQIDEEEIGAFNEVRYAD
jgi:hypothetical protein